MRGRGIRQLLLVNALWACTPVAAKVALGSFGAYQLAWLRCFTAWLAISPALAIPSVVRSAGIHAKTRNYVEAAFVGVFSFGLGPVLLMHGMRDTPASMASIVLSTEPLATTVMSRVLIGEELTARLSAAIAVGTIGFVVLARPAEWGTGATGLLPTLLITGSVVAEAAYTISARRLTTSLGAIRFLSTALGAGLVAQTVFVVARPGLPMWGTVTLSSLVAVFWLGPVAVSACGILWLRILREVEATKAGVWLLIQPVLGVALGVIVLGETVHALDIAGALLIIAALTAAGSPGPRRSP